MSPWSTAAKTTGTSPLWKDSCFTTRRSGTGPSKLEQRKTNRVRSVGDTNFLFSDRKWIHTFKTTWWILEFVHIFTALFSCAWISKQSYGVLLFTCKHTCGCTVGPGCSSWSRKQNRADKRWNKSSTRLKLLTWADRRTWVRSPSEHGSSARASGRTARPPLNTRGPLLGRERW